MSEQEIQNLKNLLLSETTFNIGFEILKQLDQEDYEVFYNDANAANVVIYSGLFTTKQENFKSIPYNKGKFGGMLHLPMNVKNLVKYNLGII